MVIGELLGATEGVELLPPRHRDLLPEARRIMVIPDTVLAWADRLAIEPDTVLPYSAFLRFFHDGNRQEYEGHYFGRRRRLEVFAFAVLSGRGDRFLGPLQNVLAAVCDETTWALPAHLADPAESNTVDLFAAETASALAEIRCLLEGRLDPGLVERIEDQINLRVLRPYEATHTPWHWETCTHNWAAVCGGGVGIAALWLSDTPRLKALLSRLGPTLDAYLSGFPGDGICLEGMGYWTYGFGYFVAFAELLKDRSQGQIDLLSHPALVPRLAAIAAFPEAGRLGNRDFARFSDGPEEFRYPPGVVSRLAERLGSHRGLPPVLAETLADDPCCRWVRHLRDFLWTATPDAGLVTASPLVRWFADSQWLVARGRVHDLVVGLAVKGGHNDEPHNHNDVGGFQVVVGDHAYLDDLGAGRYERNYFSQGRYGFFVTSSRSHSVPLVNGQEQVAGADRRAKDVRFSEGHPTHLTMDLAGAYAVPGLKALQRTITLTPGSVFPMALVDTARRGAVEELAITERFVTRLPVRVEPQGVSFDGPEGSLHLRASVTPLSITVAPVSYAPHEGPDRTAFCIDFAYRTEERSSNPALEYAFHLDFTPNSPSEEPLL